MGGASGASAMAGNRREGTVEKSEGECVCVELMCAEGECVCMELMCEEGEGVCVELMCEEAAVEANGSGPS